MGSIPMITLLQIRQIYNRQQYRSILNGIGNGGVKIVRGSPLIEVLVLVYFEIYITTNHTMKY